jgi:hypothetical protein
MRLAVGCETQLVAVAAHDSFGAGSASRTEKENPKRWTARRTDG